MARLAAGLSITCAVVVLAISCSLKDSLGPVAGVEGELQVSGEWPDSIKAAALIVLDDVVLEDAADHLIAFSDPLMPGDTLIPYFVQLRPGRYYLVAAGLTVEPALFLANMEANSADGDIPFVILDDDLSAIATPVLIRKDEVVQVNRTISF
ncbi:MAG: hypothetical protein JSU77_01350 [Fidelibacterota bacterium]|nr:MAG: hypothetical protein JSU77_01350 [Candidatus Neomarinimicrobiota bacterium]